MKVLPIERLDARKDAALRRVGYLTFDGWRLQDRTVVKGEKARERNSHGLPLFHRDQTAVLDSAQENIGFDEENDYGLTWWEMHGGGGD